MYQTDETITVDDERVQHVAASTGMPAEVVIGLSTFLAWCHEMPVGETLDAAVKSVDEVDNLMADLTRRAMMATV